MSRNQYDSGTIEPDHLSNKTILFLKTVLSKRTSL